MFTWYAPGRVDQGLRQALSAQQDASHIFLLDRNSGAVQQRRALNPRALRQWGLWCIDRVSGHLQKETWDPVREQMAGCSDDQALRLALVAADWALGIVSDHRPRGVDWSSVRAVELQAQDAELERVTR
jgi:hypothetical protein